jgi:DNA-directed RNA polymerase I, II, and III subunit RPABC1
MTSVTTTPTHPTISVQPTVPVQPTISPVVTTSLQQNSTLKTFDKIMTTVHEMFIDRGYDIVQKQSWSKKFTQFEDLKVVAKIDANILIFTFFATDVKVPVRKIREYVQFMKENQVTHAVIVHAHQITPGAKSELNQYNIQTFQAKELFHNITRHALVPRHEKLKTDHDIQAVMKRYHIQSKNEFPIYYTSDPMVKYFGWQPGTVVKIERALGGLKEPEVYYRMVKAE